MCVWDWRGCVCVCSHVVMNVQVGMYVCVHIDASMGIVNGCMDS